MRRFVGAQHRARSVGADDGRQSRRVVFAVEHRARDDGARLALADVGYQVADFRVEMRVERQLVDDYMLHAANCVSEHDQLDDTQNGHLL